MAAKASGKARGKRASARSYVQAGFALFLIVQAILWYGAGIGVVGKLSPRVFFATAKGMVTAATFFWGAVFLSALVFGPVYCGWVCAFGSYQDAVWGLLGRGRGRNGAARPAPALPDWLKLLRYAKYVLLVFLVSRPIVDAVRHPASKVVFRLGMPAPLDGMLNPGSVAWIGGTALLVYLLGSRAWCRYICPFGTAISLLSRVAPYRVRVSGECAGCGACDRACPKGVEVSGFARAGLPVRSLECVGCTDCVNACPSGILYYGPPKPGVDGKPDSSGC